MARVVAAGHEQGIPGRQLATNAEAAQQRGPFDRPASPGLEDVARIAQAMGGNDITKRRSGIRRQPPGAATGASLADPLGFQDKRVEARHGAGVGDGASGDAGADDDDISGTVTTKARVGRPGGCQRVNPGRGTVTCGHERRLYL